MWFRGRVHLVIDADQDKLLYFMGLVCSQTCSRFVHRSRNELYQTAPNGVSGTCCLLFMVLSLISVTAVQHLELTWDSEYCNMTADQVVKRETLISPMFHVVLKENVFERTSVDVAV